MSLASAGGKNRLDTICGKQGIHETNAGLDLMQNITEINAILKRLVDILQGDGEPGRILQYVLICNSSDKRRANLVEKLCAVQVIQMVINLALAQFRMY
jgi:hypothetical protein